MKNRLFNPAAAFGYEKSRPLMWTRYSKHTTVVGPFDQSIFCRFVD